MAARRPGRTIVCDVSGLPPDAGAIDSLARLQLAARRQRMEVRLCEVSSELHELLALCGLGDVLCVEVTGQSEQREEGVGVEEERQLGDLPS
jgi:gamma-glutamyl:cysteine ligase YbdK (ATP-grasp superfamily)